MCKNPLNSSISFQNRQNSQSSMTPFQCYQRYLVLKRHFGDPGFNGEKYNWKTNASLASFDKRRDKYFFHTLSKKPDPEGLLVSNLVQDPDTWIRDLVQSPDAASCHTAWVKRRDSLTRVFQSELELLNDEMQSNFLVSDQWPSVFALYRQKKLSLETLVLLDDILSLVPYWDKSIKENIVWPILRNKIIKYRSFIQFDRQKIKEVFRARFDLQ